MNYSEGMNRLKREDEYKKILSKDFLIQCAESYNIEEWNTEYRKYLENEWGYHFPEIPFSYDKVSYFFSLNAFIAKINYHNEDFTANGKRNKINLSNFHLQGVNFNHAILKDVCFSDAVLIGANFSETSLQGADFRRANLENVIFTAADISNANFSRSNLTNADMTQAKASNTSFMEGRLNKTKFIETKLEGANFTLSAMDGETLFHSIQIDNKTNFTSTPIDVCRIYPPKTKKILKQNIPHLDNTNNNVFVAMKFGKGDITSALENVIKPICSDYGFSAKKSG